MEQKEHVLFIQFIYYDFVFLTVGKNYFAFVEIMGAHVCLLGFSTSKLFYAEMYPLQNGKASSSWGLYLMMLLSC